MSIILPINHITCSMIDVGQYVNNEKVEVAEGAIRGTQCIIIKFIVKKVLSRWKSVSH